MRRSRHPPERAREQVGRPDEAGDEDAGRPPVDLLRRADLLDVASAHHRDPVTHREGLTLVVGDEDERDPDLAVGIRLSSICIASRNLRSARPMVRRVGARARQVDECSRQGDASVAAHPRVASGGDWRARRGGPPRACRWPVDGPCPPAPSSTAVRTPRCRAPSCGGTARTPCWNTVLTLRLYGGTFDTSTPSSMTWPLVGCSKPAIIFSSVVLPQPDGPRSEKNSPRPIVKSARSTAKSPNSLRTPSSTITSSFKTATSPTWSNRTLSALGGRVLRTRTTGSSVVGANRFDGRLELADQPVGGGHRPVPGGSIAKSTASRCRACKVGVKHL